MLPAHGHMCLFIYVVYFDKYFWLKVKAVHNTHHEHVHSTHKYIISCTCYLFCKSTLVNCENINAEYIATHIHIIIKGSKFIVLPHQVYCACAYTYICINPGTYIVCEASSNITFYRGVGSNL